MTLDAAIELVDESKKAFNQENLNLLMQEALGAGTPPKIVFSKVFEEQRRAKITEACYNFARTGSWPPLPAAEQLLIYERLKAARSLLWAFQNASGPSVGVAPEADRFSLLSFLLVEYWAMIALETWQLKYGEEKRAPGSETDS